MRRIILSFVLVSVLSFCTVGCGKGGNSAASGTGSAGQVSSVSEVTETSTFLSESTEASVPEEEQWEPPFDQGEPGEAKYYYESQYVTRYYSDDRSVYLRIDEEKEDYSIVDGDLVIPVELHLARYGCDIVRTDIDGDGIFEYLIAENEGSGTGCNMNGLVIVGKTGEDYTLTRFDSECFAQILNRRVTYEFNAEYHMVSMFIDGESDPYNGPLYVKKAEDAAEKPFTGLSFGDIIKIFFFDGKPWVVGCAGFTFDNNVPHYEITYNVSAPIKVNSDRSMEVGDIRGYHYDEGGLFEIHPYEKEIDLYNCDLFDIDHDGEKDRLRVSYIVTDDFDGEINDSMFHNGAMGYVEIVSTDYVNFENSTKGLNGYVPFWFTDYACAHPGNKQIFATTVDGIDYLVVTNCYSGQGASLFDYEVFFVNGEPAIFPVDSQRITFETENQPDLTPFWDGLYKWINESSVLLVATDVDSDPDVIYSLDDNLVNPDVYYSKKKEATKKKVLKDESAPVFLYFKGSPQLKVGSEFNVHKYIGYADDVDREVDLKVQGSVDVNTVGTYPLKLTLTDDAGHTTVKDMTVSIVTEITSSGGGGMEKEQFSDFIANFKTEENKLGVDISRWQGNPDFAKMKAAGCEFVYMRIGGYDSGEFFTDKSYVQNMRDAKANGMMVGIYWYGEEDTTEKVEASVAHLMEILGGETLDFPIAYDWEDYRNFEYHHMNLSDLNDRFDEFEKEVEKYGYHACLYGSKNAQQNIWTRAKKNPVWLAHYNIATSYSDPFFMWQRSNTGRIDGINGDVDLDIFFPDRLNLE